MSNKTSSSEPGSLSVVVIVLMLGVLAAGGFFAIRIIHWESRAQTATYIMGETLVLSYEGCHHEIRVDKYEPPEGGDYGRSGKYTVIVDESFSMVVSAGTSFKVGNCDYGVFRNALYDARGNALVPFSHAPEVTVTMKGGDHKSPPPLLSISIQLYLRV